MSISTLYPAFTDALSHSLLVQEKENSQWQVPESFSKLTFHMNKTLQSRGGSLLLSYAKEAKLASDHLL